MRAEDIKDADSLQAWLKSLPQETEEQRETARRWAVTIAHRAAMRVLPFLVRANSVSSEYQAMQTLLAFRSCLVSQLFSRRKLQRHFDLDAVNISNATNILKGVAGFRLDRDPLDSAAHSDAKTSRAAFEVFNAATWSVAIADGENDNLRKLAEAVQLAAGDLGNAVMTAIKSDAIALSQGQIVVELSIWEASDRPIQIWQDAKKTLLHMGDGWRFWVEWYENALFGRPPDDDLLAKIAGIDFADWEKSADHVNALIQRIVAEHKPKPAPQPPEITDVERSHINLVLAAPEPARQSAEFLQKQFESMEQAYRRELGCPNETPPELEPIVTLSRTFGQIAHLLRTVDDKDKLIAELNVKIAALEATNAQLVSLANSANSSRLSRIFDGAMGAVSAHVIIATYAQLGGPSVIDGIGALWELITPAQPIQPTVKQIPPVLDV